MPPPHSVQTEEAQRDKNTQVPEGAARPASKKARREIERHIEETVLQHSEGCSTGNSDTNSDPTRIRRSTRANKGRFDSTRHINEVFLSQNSQFEGLNTHSAAFVYQAELQTDMDTYETNICDPRVYNAKFAKRGTSPDAPTFHQAISGLEAMKVEWCTGIDRGSVSVAINRNMV